MIVLTVQSFNGSPTESLSASFDEIGGTIGRADTNQLVLPDPERSISRTHAQVVYRNGHYAIVDRGSNAVLVNGQPVGNGREVPIRDGDQVQIGGYVIGVSFGHKTMAKDPFADLFGSGDDFGAPAPRPAPPPPAAAASLFDSPAWPPPPPAAPLMPPPASPPPPAGGASLLSDDWDPFAKAAPPASSGLGAPPVSGSDPFGSDLPFQAPGGQNDLDAMFGLGGLGGSSGGDPFAGTPIAAAPSAPNTAADADPMRAFGLGSAPAAAPPVSDHVSEMNLPWDAQPLKPPSAPVPPPAPPAAAGAGLSGAVLSWNQPSREARVIATPPGRRPEAVDPADRTRIVVAPKKAPAAAPAAMAAPPAYPPPAPPAFAAGPAAAPDELMRAFLEGLGLPQLQAGPLDAERMRLIGALLRESTRGAVELLVARAALKREMRAEMTMIVARENNPLKFSPTADVALNHLLGPPTAGFMAPAKAMRDAFDDLRAHQLGVMAGMRAALEGVLQRFDPGELESKISKRGGLGGIIPATRKARLWEQFQELYTQLSAEAADDFHELFGKAFLKAYEAQLDQIQGQG